MGKILAGRYMVMVIGARGRGPGCEDSCADILRPVPCGQKLAQSLGFVGEAQLRLLAQGDGVRDPEAFWRGNLGHHKALASRQAVPGEHTKKL